MHQNRRDLFGYLDQIVLPVLLEIIDERILTRHRLDTSQEFVIHYTSIPNLFHILDKGQIYLFDSDNTNDPDEGTFFTERLDISERFSWLSSPKRSHAYIASFVIPQPGINAQDNLVYWRTYGREGEGCSMQLSIEHLVSNSKLQKVLYGDQEVAVTRAALEPILEVLEPLASESDTVSELVATTVWNALGSLRHLYKDIAYDYESECRYIIPESEPALDTISFCYGDSALAPARVRHYCESDEMLLDKLLVSGATIVLGPAIPDKASLNRALKLFIRKLEYYGPQVIHSEISYRTT